MEYRCSAFQVQSGRTCGKSIVLAAAAAGSCANVMLMETPMHPVPPTVK